LIYQIKNNLKCFFRYLSTEFTADDPDQWSRFFIRPSTNPPTDNRFKLMCLGNRRFVRPEPATDVLVADVGKCVKKTSEK
jgi:hypothetical protein